MISNSYDQSPSPSFAHHHLIPTLPFPVPPPTICIVSFSSASLVSSPLAPSTPPPLLLLPPTFSLPLPSPHLLPSFPSPPLLLSSSYALLYLLPFFTPPLLSSPSPPSNSSPASKEKLDMDLLNYTPLKLYTRKMK